MLSGGITPFFPPASTTMLHNVIRSSIYPKGTSYQNNKNKKIKRSGIEETLRVTLRHSLTSSLSILTFRLSTVEPTNSIDL